MLMLTRPALLATALLAAIGFPLLACADTGDASPAHARLTADAHVKAGLAANAGGKFELAREEFIQAEALDPRWTTLDLLGLSELRTNHALDAYRHCRAALGDSTVSAEARATIQTHVTQAYMRTGHILITAPPGAEVTVDGRSAGRTPMDDAVDVEPGEHIVLASLEGATVSAAFPVRIADAPEAIYRWVGEGAARALHMTAPGVDASALPITMHPVPGTDVITTF